MLKNARLLFVNFSRDRRFKTVLILCLILGIFQSLFTNIGLDESYYWRFAQDLDWAYFDHPPMVALMIAIGDFILPGIAGVRLMTVVLSLLTYYILWLLIPEESRRKEGSSLLFFLLVTTSPLLVIYSFITTPDVPLIFFSALYLWLLKRFLEKQDLLTSLLLGLTMSCLIYSKYHGLLVILITVAVQPKLFKSPLFYLAGLFGLFLYMPHLYWQYKHDFISFNYHLSYRSVQYEFKNVYVYFINVLLILNPLLFPLFVYQFFKHGIKASEHNRTFNAIIWGFLLFFAFTSFRGHVEPQWIVVVTIPLIVYFFQYIQENPKLKKTFLWLSGISFFLVLMARVVLALPIKINSEFHLWTGREYEQIKSIAQGKTVVFNNSYTQAARYSFYTGEDAFSYNFVAFRKNQYDLWDYHKKLQNKDILFVAFSNSKDFEQTVLNNGERIGHKVVRNAQIVNSLNVEVTDYKQMQDSIGKMQVDFRVTNPYGDSVHFNKSGSELTWLLYFFYLDKERVEPAFMVPEHLEALPPNSVTELKLNFEVEMKAGEYTFGVHIQPTQLYPITLGKRTYPVTFK